jgi:hypothetical protein
MPAGVACSALGAQAGAVVWPGGRGDSGLRSRRQVCALRQPFMGLRKVGFGSIYEDQSSPYRPQGRLMRAYQAYIHVPVAAVNACVVTRPPRGVRTSALAICGLILTSRRVERCLYWGVEDSDAQEGDCKEKLPRHIRISSVWGHTDASGAKRTTGPAN